MLEDGLYQFTGHYEFFGKKQPLEFKNLSQQERGIIGQGSCSKGDFKLIGSFSFDDQDSEFSVTYPSSYVQNFKGQFERDGEGNLMRPVKMNGSWVIADKSRGTFMITVESYEPPKPFYQTQAENIMKEQLVKLTENCRKADIMLNICTPEKAYLEQDVRLDMTINDLKEMVLKNQRFFDLGYDPKMSTKNLKGITKKFGNKVSSIDASHSQSRYEIHRFHENQHNNINIRFESNDLDFGALQDYRTLEYYNILNGATLFLHVEFTIEIAGLDMLSDIKTNNWVIQKKKVKSLLPHFHVKCYPTDSVAKVKKVIYAYLKKCIKEAIDNNSGSQSELDSIYQIDMDRIKPEKWVLQRDGAEYVLTESYPMSHYFIEGYTLFNMQKIAGTKNMNVVASTGVDSKILKKEFCRVTRYKEDKHTPPEIKPNCNEFILYVDTCHAGRLKDVKVRPNMTIANVKEQVTKKLKSNLGIEMTPGEYYLKHITQGIIAETKTVRELHLKSFDQVMIVRCDSVIV